MERETRVLLLSVLLIVLPSLLLSYVGLGAIEREDAALSVRRQRADARLAREVGGDLERVLSAATSSLDRLASGPPAGRQLLAERFALARRELAKGELCGEPLVLGVDGALVEQIAAGGRVTPPRAALDEARELAARGETDAAIIRFEALAADPEEPAHVRAAALLGLAAAKQAAGALPEARTALRQLIGRYPLAVGAEGVRLALSARQRLAELQSGRDAAVAWLALAEALTSAGEAPAAQRRFHAWAVERAVPPLLATMRDPALELRWRAYLRQRDLRLAAERRRRRLAAQLAPVARAVASGGRPLAGMIAAAELEPGARSSGGAPTAADADEPIYAYRTLRPRGEPPLLVVVGLRGAALAELLRQADLGGAPALLHAGGRPVGAQPAASWRERARQPLGALPLELVLYASGEPETASDNRLVVWVVALALVGLLLGSVVVMRTVMRELRAAQLKSDFVSNVTHELKTPLTSIRMFVETLQLGRFRSEEQRGECLDRIGRETGRLQRLIDRVLEFSKIDRGTKTFRFELADVGDVVDQALRLLAAETELAEGELEVSLPDPPPRARIDAEAMVEVVLNLLQNATKYSDPPRRIQLAVEVADGRLRIAVSDRGIGVPLSEQKRIFRKFYRVDDKLNRRADGAGLGLTLCAAIVRAHGGRLELQSEPGVGSTFTAILPLEAAPDGDDPGHRG